TNQAIIIFWLFLTVLFDISIRSVSRRLAMLLWIHYVNRNKVFNCRSDYLGKRVQGRGVESTKENFSPQSGDQLIARDIATNPLFNRSFECLLLQ
ncbi:MAG: hypothetical protein WA220_12605, partial [Candidatus Nitrosopolaris sp.]